MRGMRRCVGAYRKHQQLLHEQRSEQWRIEIPTYARLMEKAVYDGIDFVFHSHGGPVGIRFRGCRRRR